MLDPLPDAVAALARLKDAARADLAALAYPAAPWLAPLPVSTLSVCDVAIVGGGQSAITIAAALKWDGVQQIRLFDSAPAGAEGPWTTFARMEELRTPKTAVGNEFNVANLSVRRWFETRYGLKAWQTLGRIPRTDWKAYLDWYAEVFDIAITNETSVTDVSPEGDLMAVTTLRQGHVERHLARAVVLATGFDGAGAWRVPHFISDALPSQRYDHTNGPVDFHRLKGKRIGILGHGASAFDNAVTALNSGAASVDLCFRRTRLPRTNPHRALEAPPLLSGFGALSDQTRWQIARFFRSTDQPPPVRAFETAMALPGFTLRPATPWLEVCEKDGAVSVKTPDGMLVFDHLLLATGMDVDLSARPELKTLAPKVALWGEHFTPPAGEEDARLSQLPYLDPYYAFLPKAPEDSWVSRVFAFNSASFVSHGPHSTSISGHRYALPRVVRGIERRLLLDQEQAILPGLEAYCSQDLPVSDDFEADIAARNAARMMEKAS
ncbi:SidA/IucD/PvdA family monooxygenase [Agrobacterium vitis]|uniref:SidA/IucD/PvdA family monooxygenase n=1 Tax=Agrobacterium vitis TaxID=373 RepID=A0ABD6GD30_AGRVI|nr:NAD(P)/FAD-dependent oxidoreductase [Agrobacterium vitis]MUO80686.1 SidA/IucD/PvdA family monooxygenase [Agrobacterium vitis]MUO96392.1 SidA/IucD/PvdA family monooxygenase [Agrobacterium vitis]MUP07225.1 SidA/IucD/PvdA family monooxygenase [Agrobacterium vitis]MUZ82042.1 SidA/IucD/PvdA family monooxygenase [Agrobacterium vitis]MVA09774.1 SidA/IucD/PvdA family monooxygenase [Agrobacterium vitis]